MRTINLSNFETDLNLVLGEIDEGAAPVTVVRKDGVAIVMLTLAEYASLVETAHLLSTPGNAAHLAQSLEQYRTGQVAKHDLFEVSDENPQPLVDD
jgi:antitoxin YefM